MHHPSERPHINRLDQGCAAYLSKSLFRYRFSDILNNLNDVHHDGENRVQNRQGSTDNSRRGIIAPVIGGLIILLLIGLFISPLFFTAPAMRPYGYYYYSRPFFFFPLGFLIFIFLIFLVARWFFWGWGWRRGYYRGYAHHVDATEILKQRYARGEITKEQFDQMMKDLGEKS